MKIPLRAVVDGCLNKLREQKPKPKVAGPNFVEALRKLPRYEPGMLIMKKTEYGQFVHLDDVVHMLDNAQKNSK